MKTELKRCLACNHEFEAKRYLAYTPGQMGHYRWEVLCEICDLLQAAHERMEEAKKMLAHVKVLAEARRGLRTG